MKWGDRAEWAMVALWALAVGACLWLLRGLGA